MARPPPPNPDTIAAVATPTGRGGVGVVRVSGADLGELAKALIGRLPEPRRASLAKFLAADGSVIDSGLAIYFPAPHSFTGESVLELQGHGGPVVMNMLLRRCLTLGARLARPGEFSERAFHNGKLDLAQAEAVADLIDAGTEAAARSAVRSLQGEFSAAINALIEQLIALRALVEATLDFPEEEIDFLKSADAFSRIDSLRSTLEEVFVRAQRGQLLRTGLHIVLIGQPNVGKSSLLNRLAGDELAIVSEHAGTTRDSLRSTIQLRGVPLHIIDTAGLRDTEDTVEQLGISRTWREIARADVALIITDARVGLQAADQAFINRLPTQLGRIFVQNKSDLLEATEITNPQCTAALNEVFHVSAKRGDGLVALEEALLNASGFQPSEDNFVARERHLDALRRAKSHLGAAKDAGEALELLAEELRLTHQALQEITGEFAADELLGEIFSSFCIGK